MTRAVLMAVLTACVAACASTPIDSQQTPDPQPAGAVPSPAPAPAPWHQPMLSPDSIPAAYLTQWRQAPNRASCALIAPLSPDPRAAPRAATFSGGWAVAYDLPSMRSAFGVAGTGSSANDPSYDAWPHRIQWADGSSAGYGPEGGTGPGQLAYLRIAGQGCLYNVWSKVGVEHLETMLRDLRFVRVKE